MTDAFRCVELVDTLQPPELNNFRNVDMFDFETQPLVSLVPLATHTADLIEHIIEVSRSFTYE